MRYPVSAGNNEFKVRPGIARLVLIAVTLFLAACGFLGASGDNQTPNLGHQTSLQLNTEATLTCSQECADTGWCGETSDQRPVVLGNAIDPSIVPHDRVFPQDTLVNIDFIALATIERVATGDQSQLPFYHVTSLGDGKSAWIAGWCITGP